MIEKREYGRSGPLVITLHGGPGAFGYMAPVAQGLETSFRVWEPSQSGSGPEPLAVAQHVSDLHELILSRDGSEPVALVGHSWGAMLALAYAAEHSGQVQALALIACGTFDVPSMQSLQRSLNERMVEGVQARINALKKDFSDPNERFMVMSDLTLPLYSHDLSSTDLRIETYDGRAYQETWDDMMRLQQEGYYPATFASIRAPVLMLHGATDPHPGRMIRDSLQPHLPHMEYRELVDCGHYPWLEKSVGGDLFVELKEWLGNQFSNVSPKATPRVNTAPVSVSTPEKEKCLWMYRTMVTIRRFEEQAKREQDSGRIRGIHSAIGQEAVATGLCASLRPDDYLLGHHRGHGHGIVKGLDLGEMMAELLGKITGTNAGKGGSMHIADASKGMLGATGVIGSNIPVAVGCALAAKIKDTDQVSMVFFGDGGSSQGSLHEAMNIASIWDLPVVFVCENNRYAISTPAEYAIAGGSVANRANGYDMPGVMEMFEVGAAAVDRARQGLGPSLIEALTYRTHGHGGFENPLNYRTSEEQEYYQNRDCIKQMHEYIRVNEFASENELSEVSDQATELVKTATKFANESPYPPAGDLMKHNYVDKQNLFQ